MIKYLEFGSELVSDAYNIYRDNGWGAYLTSLDKLKKAFDNSLYILGAFEEDKLVGFIRCIGDSEFIIYIQDLIVLPEYQRRGIGKTLVKKVSDKFSDVRQFVLITDKDDEKANAFYRAIGMKTTLNGYPINTYFRDKI